MKIKKLALGLLLTEEEKACSWQGVDTDSVTLVTGQFQSIGWSALIGGHRPYLTGLTLPATHLP